MFCYLNSNFHLKFGETEVVMKMDFSYVVRFSLNMSFNYFGNFSFLRKNVFMGKLRPVYFPHEIIS